MQPIEPQPAIALTQKELLLRLEGMLVTHITQSQEAHNQFMNTMAEIRERQALHESDHHPQAVAELKSKDTREEGRKDVLKYIFGTSVIALVCGVGGLIIAVFKLTGG